jgi:tetratricopeptide (TPR) repeat protein
MPAPNSRTVRVFLSSTFRDFTGERDLLVKTIFPELRRRCRERQVELVDVDLRWGITEEEAQQGKVLPICLAEIDRSRPFFMGFLGERYGWVPEAGQYDLSLLLEQPWLAENKYLGNKSVTELEILHGVLDNPAMEKRAFFYFRDPSWSEAQGGAYLCEGTDEKAKLEELKDRIRQSGFPVVENYASPEELAERVREDLWQLIDEAYPESEVPDALTRERMTHEAYGASRRRLYLGGEPYFAALDMAMAAEPFRPVLVRGQSGGGKSALLANWVAGWSERHPATTVIVHHLGCGADAADPVRMVVRLMREISRLTGDEFKPESDPEKQLEQLPQWLGLASAWAQRTGRELLLVLDGLDKVSAFTHLRWFPGFLPQGVKLVASCLDGEILAAVRPRLEWTELEVEPFTPQEQITFIKKYLGRYRKELTTRQSRTLLAHPLSGNPLFLLTVLEELRVFGVHEQIESRLHTLLSPPPGKPTDEAPTVDDVFEHVLARIEEDLGRGGVQSAMESIWASRGGLYQDELLAIAGIAPATWAGMANALDEALYESGGRIQFAHDYLRKAVEDRYGLTGEEKRLRHRRLAEWFAARKVDERVASELPWQWREAEAREELVACLVDKKIFEHELRRDEYELLGYWLWTGEDLEAAYAAAWSGWDKIRADSAEADPENDRILTPLRVGLFLQSAGVYGDFTELLFRVSCEESVKTFGQDHLGSIGCVEYCADLMLDKGDYIQAETIYRRVLEVYEKALGPKHPDTLNSVRSLGNLLREKGDYDEANPFLCRALEGLEKALGPEHPDTLNSINSLGNLMMEKGDYDSAEELYRRALKGYEKIFGAMDRNTIAMVINLGHVLTDKGNFDNAEPLYRRALEGYEKALGSEHPDTLECVNSLGKLLMGIGNFEAAEILFRRALSGKEKSLGSANPDTLSSAHNLGILLKNIGDYDASEALCRRVLEGNEKALGYDHPRTVTSLLSLGNLLREIGDYPEAEMHYSRALSNAERILGEGHPETLRIVRGFALLYASTGDKARAENFYERGICGLTNSLGISSSADFAYAFGKIVSECRSADEATEFLKSLLKRFETALGEQHPYIVTWLKSLGGRAYQTGKLEKSEIYFSRAYHAIRGSSEEFEEQGQAIATVLVTLLENRGAITDAESIRRHQFEAIQKNLGSEHPDTTAAAYGLAGILNRLQRRPEAIALLRRFAVLSDDSRDAVAYNLACYECLEGNHDEAKRLIAEHLERHPEKKAQTLADEDFAAIREWIKTSA